MPKTFLLTDQGITGNMAAERLRGLNGRACYYSPSSPWERGEGALVDEETGHAFARFEKQRGRKVIVLDDDREDFLQSILVVASPMP